MHARARVARVCTSVYVDVRVRASISSHAVTVQAEVVPSLFLEVPFCSMFDDVTIIISTRLVLHYSHCFQVLDDSKTVADTISDGKVRRRLAARVR